MDSPLEGDGFEPSVPRKRISVFGDHPAQLLSSSRNLLTQGSRRDGGSDSCRLAGR